MKFFSFSSLSGHFHDAGGRPMEMDTVGVLHEFSTILARFRSDMVADRLQPRRSRSRELYQSESDVHTVYRRHTRIHQLLPLLDRDAAHDRVTNQIFPHSYRQLSLISDSNEFQNAINQTDAFG